MAQLVESKTKGRLFDSCQDTFLGCKWGRGVCWEATGGCFSPSLSPSLVLSKNE